ncbi:MAG: preprotein translocase subunit SecG [Planctomycetota bacterium]
MALVAILLTVIFVVACILLIIVILVQPHYSESGLAGALGGGGGMDSFLGVKAVSVATKITVVLAVIFLLLAIVLGQIPRTSSRGGLLSREKPAPKEPLTKTTETTTPISTTQESTVTPVSPTQSTSQTPQTPVETPKEDNKPKESQEPVSPTGK